MEQLEPFPVQHQREHDQGNRCTPKSRFNNGSLYVVIIIVVGRHCRRYNNACRSRYKPCSIRFKIRDFLAFSPYDIWYYGLEPLI